MGEHAFPSGMGAVGVGVGDGGTTGTLELCGPHNYVDIVINQDSEIWETVPKLWAN